MILVCQCCGVLFDGVTHEERVCLSCWEAPRRRRDAQASKAAAALAGDVSSPAAPAADGECRMPVGFRWEDGHGDVPRKDLRAPSGRKAATVFTVSDQGGFNWYVWDERGVGGENSRARDRRGGAARGGRGRRPVGPSRSTTERQVPLKVSIDVEPAPDGSPAVLAFRMYLDADGRCVSVGLEHVPGRELEGAALAFKLGQAAVGDAAGRSAAELLLRSLVRPPRAEGGGG